MEGVTQDRLAAYVVRSLDGGHSGEGRIREWAKESDCAVTWVVDEPDPEEVVIDRQGHRAILQLLRWRKVGGVVVVDRAAFGPDPVVQEILIHEIERLGGTFIELQPSHSESEADRHLIRRSIELARTYESRSLSDRLRSGRATKAARGGYAYGAPAYGYASRSGELLAREEEQTVIRRMAALRDEGFSYRVIAQRLNAQGSTPKRGKEWHPESVRRVLRREGLVSQGTAA